MKLADVYGSEDPEEMVIEWLLDEAFYWDETARHSWVPRMAEEKAELLRFAASLLRIYHGAG